MFLSVEENPYMLRLIVRSVSEPEKIFIASWNGRGKATVAFERPYLFLAIRTRFEPMDVRLGVCFCVCLCAYVWWKYAEWITHATNLQKQFSFLWLQVPSIVDFSFNFFSLLKNVQVFLNRSKKRIQYFFDFSLLVCDTHFQHQRVVNLPEMTRKRIFRSD